MQQQFDFNRGDQLGLLRSINIADGDSVSGTACKAVLRAIDDFGRECFASIPTVATSANVSERVCKRAIARLVKLSLVTRERHLNSFGTVTNHYRIVWSEVELLSRVGGPLVDTQRSPKGRPLVDSHGLKTNRPFGQTNGPLATDQWATLTDHGAISDRPMGHHGPQSERSEKDPPLTGASEAAAVDFRLWTEEARRTAMERLRALMERPGNAIAAAERSGIGPIELKRICEEFQANRMLFRSAGAIIDRLRSGSWPVSGVRSAEELEQAAIVGQSRRSKFNRESIRCDVAAEWKRIGKWEHASNSEIEEEVDRRCQSLVSASAESERK